MASAFNPVANRLTPYKPGQPIDDVARKLGIDRIVKLASNENPRGPAPVVQERIRSRIGDLSRYPDGNGTRLKLALAAVHDMEPDGITLGNGSNDVLELVARAVLTPGSEAIMAEHAFIVYRLATLGCGADPVIVPARDFGADLDAMLDQVSERTRLVFIANPNNPTGVMRDEASLVHFLTQLPEHVWTVLDEAYFEYVQAPDYPDGRGLLRQFPNLVVTRTFSKIHALAGLRIGYGLSAPRMADMMNRFRHPFNANSLALAAAETALGATDFVAESRALNQAGLAQLGEGLGNLGFRFIPSCGNFLAVDAGREAAPLFDALLREGVIVRTIAEYDLPNHFRVTVGLPKENQRFLDALARVSRQDAD